MNIKKINYSDVKTKSKFNSFICKGAAKTHLRSQLQLTEVDNFIYY